SSEIAGGRAFTTSETDAKVVVADASYAEQKKLSVGGTVTVQGVTSKVVGIATPDSGDAAASPTRDCPMCPPTRSRPAGASGRRATSPRPSPPNSGSPRVSSAAP